eukprot:2436263-Ditylum_brightwellii.AAC.1
MLKTKAENIDLTEYCIDVMNETKRHQSKSALCILRAALATVLEVKASDVVHISTKQMSETAKPQGSVFLNNE